MIALQREQSRRAGFIRGEAGDEISDLRADLVADLACALDARDLGGAGPCEM
jgi:hypothetical protein